MQIDVHLHGILRDQLPPEAKGRARLGLGDGATVGDLLAHLGIKRRVVVALNDDHEPDETHVLQDGDEVSIYTIIGGGGYET
ncbi:MAG: MoaD/ThiS family protein [Anaerolineales bacterium]